VKGGKGKPKEEARAAFEAARAEPELRA
jgi:hypothetical protein